MDISTTTDIVEETNAENIDAEASKESINSKPTESDPNATQDIADKTSKKQKKSGNGQSEGSLTFEVEVKKKPGIAKEDHREGVETEHKSIKRKKISEPEIDVYQEPKAEEINLKSLLQSGVHFGHQTSRWNPKMEPYIFTQRNGIHIINLPLTITCWEAARDKITQITSLGGRTLFVGTKKQAQEAIEEEACRCGEFFVIHRWLGGMLTNFKTIRKSVDRMNQYEETIAQDEVCIERGIAPRYTKKERLIMTREVTKLKTSLGGIQYMTQTPSLVFVVDIRREEIAVKEANKLNVPVIALVDTNTSPENIDFPIPANDDGTRAIKLFTEACADAIIQGKKLRKDRALSSKETTETASTTTGD